MLGFAALLLMFGVRSSVDGNKLSILHGELGFDAVVKHIEIHSLLVKNASGPLQHQHRV